MSWRAVFKDVTGHGGWAIKDGRNTVAVVYANTVIAPRPRGGLVKLPVNAESVKRAKLIAASEDLLSALIEVRDNAQHDAPEMWNRVDAAIAKADQK